MASIMRLLQLSRKVAIDCSKSQIKQSTRRGHALVKLGSWCGCACSILCAQPLVRLPSSPQAHKFVAGVAPIAALVRLGTAAAPLAAIPSGKHMLCLAAVSLQASVP